ncbi:MAG: GvpL/GvpF family gas vesicle protein [Acidobacteriaceae bacterium]
MIALLYAVVPTASFRASSMKVRGALHTEIHAQVNPPYDLALLYSLFPDDAKPELPMPQSALEVHGLLQHLLELGGVVPFRLPAWLAEPEIASYLDARAEAYSDALRKISDCVQMELQLISSCLPIPLAANTAPNGRDYLRSRAAGQSAWRNAATLVREKLDSVTRAWRQHGPANNALKLSALVPRNERERFVESSAQLKLENIAIKVSGPWPATDFIHLDAPRAESNGNP